MRVPLEVFLSLRHLQPRRTFVSAITLLSVLGVTVGVMVLIVVLSVMAGFEQDLQDKVIGFNAHLTLSNGGVLEDSSTWLEELKKEPEVLGAAPFVSGPVMVNCKNHISTPIMRGVDPDAEEKVIPIRKYIITGDASLMGESVIVGREWAARNNVFIGDKINVFAPRADVLESLRKGEKGNHVIILPTEMMITGVFQTGLFDFDLNYVITSLENAQYLYNLHDGVHGIAVRVADPRKVDLLKKKLNAICVYPLQARTWMDQNQPLFTAIATERVAMTIIVFFIMIVAAFGLCSTLITITVQKTREIGVLKALGATDGQIRGIFLLHGLIVGSVGTVLGVALAMVFLAYRNDFRRFLLDHFGVNVFSPDVYQFINLPAETTPWLIISLSFSAILLCVLAALIPAQGAARLLPSQALRYD